MITPRKRLTKKKIQLLKKAVDDFCKKTGKTKKLIGQELGWKSASSLGNFLSGSSTLSEENAILICKAVGIDPLTILGSISQSVQMHSHSWKITAPIEKAAEHKRAVFSTNPGSWQIVEIDKDLVFEDKDFKIEVKAGSSMLFACLEEGETQNTSKYVLYAENKSSAFEILTRKQFEKKGKGFKVLDLTGMSWAGNI